MACLVSRMNFLSPRSNHGLRRWLWSRLRSASRLRVLGKKKMETHSVWTECWFIVTSHRRGWRQLIHALYNQTLRQPSGWSRQYCWAASWVNPHSHSTSSGRNRLDRVDCSHRICNWCGLCGRRCQRPWQGPCRGWQKAHRYCYTFLFQRIDVNFTVYMKQIHTWIVLHF